VGFRSALTATDPTGDHHLGGGLMFTWLAYASKHSRAALVLDLESTRWTSGRGDMTNRNQAAFYGLGFDWTMPIAFKGTGLFLGAEATYGVLQSSVMTSTAVNTDWVLQLMPHAGVGVAFHGVGLFADAGWRFQVFKDDSTSHSAGVDGLVVQGGVRVDMNEGRDVESTWNIGYTARAFTPNGRNVYSRYGGLPLTSGAGPLLGHEFTLTGIGRGGSIEQGAAFIYTGADDSGGGAALKMMELSYVLTWHAFDTHQVFNPYLGTRLGFSKVSGDAAILGSDSSYLFVAAALAGIDISLGQSFAIRGGVAYDGMLGDDFTGDSAVSGYALEAGLLFRM
jgi:hypothetical protein